MICSYCGRDNAPGATNCSSCGSRLTQPAQHSGQPQPVPPRPVSTPYAPPRIPDEYRPLSPWAYVGYNILFSIPIVGFILLIVFSVGNGNINLKNYARSFWCAALIGVIIGIVFVIIMSILGASMADILYDLY